MPCNSQWNTSFGAPQLQPSPPSVTSQTSPLAVGAAAAVDTATLQDMHAVQGQMRGGPQMPAPQYPAAPVQAFVTPAMWQESVASVYEGGLKRSWDYDGHMPVKRH